MNVTTAGPTRPAVFLHFFGIQRITFTFIAERKKPDHFVTKSMLVRSGYALRFYIFPPVAV